ADAVVAVEPGSWEFTAEMGKDVRSPPVAVEVIAGRASGPVTLRLEMLGSIEGVVRFDPPESAWASAEVAVARKGETDRRALRPVTVKPPSWTFAVEGLAPGEYEVSVASRDVEASSVAVVAEVKAGRTTVDVVVPRPAAS